MGDNATSSSQPVSFGFSSVARKKQKVAVNLEEKGEQRQLITGVQGSRIQAAEPEDGGAATQYVVPKLENTFRIGPKKFTPSFRPPASDQGLGGLNEDKYELAARPDAVGVGNYGLEIRQRKAEGGEATSEAAAPADNAVASLIDKETQQLKEDLQELPDEASLEDYESMPVEEFGMALLRGMGWKEGQGVGRKRTVVQPTQFVRRPERLGLGAAPAAPVADVRPKVKKMGDKPEPPPGDMVLPPDKDGRQRHMRALDEKLVPRAALLAGPQPGRVMRVVGGRHDGLCCQVLELLPKEEGRSDRARVRLRPSEETVEVRCKDLAESESTPAQPGKRSSGGGGSEQQERRGREAGGAERGPGSGRVGGLGSDHAHGAAGTAPARSPPSPQRRDERQQRGADGRSTGGRGGRGDGHAAHRNGDQRSPAAAAAAAAAGADSRGGWLAPNIRVRIVDKAAGRGKLYLKKGTVVDVHPGNKCDVCVDGTREVLLLSQGGLETVVPKDPGSAVLIVGGPFRRQRAKLLQCSTSAGMAAVQLAVDMSVQRVSLDDVAAFVGPVDVDEDHY